MKTILVLTDFSTRAKFAAEFAMNLAIKSKANLLLCHVIELTAPIPVDDEEFKWPVPHHLVLKNESLFGLMDLAKRLEQLMPESLGIEFRPSINCINDFGHLPEVVQKVINENSIDLMVMGSHKSNGLSRFLFGSHTYSVLDKINCPVLLVPEYLQFKGIKTIAYATDLTFSNQKVIQYLVSIAKPFEAIIAVNNISLFEFPEAVSEQVLQYSNLGIDHPSVFYHTIKKDNVKEGLLEVMDAGRVDILALVHKRYDFFERLFHASISKQMADDAKVPLLVLPYSFSLDVADFTNDQLDDFCYESNDSR